MRASKIVMIALSVALVTVGCGGGGKHVDGPGVEAAITSRFARTFAPAKVTAVSCPSKPKLAEGARFECAARVGGAPVSVAVTVVDTDGKVRFASTRPVVVTDQVEKDLADQLHDVYDEPGDVVHVEVRCPGPRVRVTDVSATFTCEVRVDGTTMREEVTVADRAGNVAFRALQ